MARYALISVALLVATNACVMKRDGPDFKRFGKSENLPLSRAPQRVSDVELAVVSASVSEAYTALGREDCTTYVDAKVTNHGQKPLVVDMNTVGTSRDGGPRTAVYLQAHSIEPTQSKQIKFAIPCLYAKTKTPFQLYLGERRFEMR